MSEQFDPTELESIPLQTLRGDMVDIILGNHLRHTIGYDGPIEVRWQFNKDLRPVAVSIYEAGYAPQT